LFHGLFSQIAKIESTVVRRGDGRLVETEGEV
jgi:hypothetical protein